MATRLGRAPETTASGAAAWVVVSAIGYPTCDAQFWLTTFSAAACWAWVGNVKLPPGYRLVWAGEFGDLQEAIKRLEIIVPISFILIAGALYSLFNNFKDSILALAGIPDAIVGGILALYVSGLHFSISAAIGFVSLFGVSVMNGILIMTYYNEVKASGVGNIEAMFRELGIADQMAAKTVLAAGGPNGRVSVKVSSGEAAIGLQQVSELISNPDVDVIGMLPGDLQQTTIYSTAITTSAKDIEGARAMIRALTAPAAVTIFESKGLDPL